MGRTNPTYRRYLEGFEADWGSFRRGLRHRHQADFDRLFAKARYFADAAGYRNANDPDVAILVSILLAQEVELRKLREAVDLEDSDLPVEMQHDDPAGDGGPGR
jgi:hypothetical protein